MSSPARSTGSLDFRPPSGSSEQEAVSPGAARPASQPTGRSPLGVAATLAAAYRRQSPQPSVSGQTDFRRSRGGRVAKRRSANREQREREGSPQPPARHLAPAQWNHPNDSQPPPPPAAFRRYDSFAPARRTGTGIHLSGGQGSGGQAVSYPLPLQPPQFTAFSNPAIQQLEESNISLIRQLDQQRRQNRDYQREIDSLKEKQRKTDFELETANNKRRHFRTEWQRAATANADAYALIQKLKKELAVLTNGELLPDPLEATLAASARFDFAVSD